jgi:hypothetical protein
MHTEILHRWRQDTDGVRRIHLRGFVSRVIDHPDTARYTSALGLDADRSRQIKYAACGPRRVQRASSPLYNMSFSGNLTAR